LDALIDKKQIEKEDELVDRMWNEISQSPKTNTIWFYLYVVPNVVKFIGTESRTVVTKGWEEELFNGYRISVLQDEEVPQICFISMCIYLRSLYCTLKNS
jgi:hypothetical protein